MPHTNKLESILYFIIDIAPKCQQKTNSLCKGILYFLSADLCSLNQERILQLSTVGSKLSMYFFFNAELMLTAQRTK